VGERALRLLQRFEKLWLGFRLRVYDLNQSDDLPPGRQVHITPAVWVNGKLWYFGSPPEDRLRAKLESLAFHQRE